jgi:hypothetical protein
MKTIQHATGSQELRSRQTRRRGLLVLVLSLALVAAACSSDDDSSDTTAVAAATATTTTAPMTTAAPTTTVAPDSADGVPLQIATVEAMYDASNAHDADAYTGYWAEDAIGWGTWTGGWAVDAAIGSPEMEKGFEERRAWGAHFTLSDCQLVDETVRCLETWDDRVLHGMAGLTIDREAISTFDDQGVITTMIHVNSNWDEAEAFFDAFGPWLTATYPEIAETYLVPGFESAYKEEIIFASPENIAEFTGLIEEFVAQSDAYPLAP